MTLRDALRKRCLFAVCRVPLGFGGISEGNDRTFSEKVRLIPTSGTIARSPGMYVKLAERDRPLSALLLSTLPRGRAAFERTGLWT